MKKVLTILLALLMMVSVLTACSSKQPADIQEPTSPPASTEDTSDEATEPETEPVVLSITWWGSQTRHDYTQQLLDLYSEKNPNVTFEATPAGWDGYFDKLSTQAASGTMPDIMQMDYLYIKTYAQNNTLADMQQFVDSNVIELANVDENLYSAGYVDGKLSGVTLSSSVFTFPYNPNVLTEAGVSEPTPSWTWEEFEDMCGQVAEQTGKYGLSTGVIDTNVFNYWVRQYGKPLFAPDSKSLGYDDDAVFADFAAMLKRLVDAGAMPNPDQWVQINSLGKEAGPVITGDGAFTYEWSNYGVIAEPTNPNIKLMTPPYAENGNKALWIKPGMFFSVAQTSENPEEAAKFINWFVNSEEANDLIMGDRGVPVSSAIREYLAPNLSEKQKEMFDYVTLALQHALTPPPPDPQGISEVNKAFVDTINQVLYGVLTPEDAAAEFRETANDILAQNN